MRSLLPSLLLLASVHCLLLNTVGCDGTDAPTNGQVDTPVELRWHWQEGDHLQVSIVAHMEMKTTHESGSLEQSFESAIDYLWKVKSVSASGVAEIDVTVDRVRLSGDGPGGKWEHDSHDETKSHEVTSTLAELVIHLKMNEQGEALDVSVDDAMLKRMSQDPEASQATQLFSPDVIRETLKAFLPVFPDDAVKTGDKWNQDIDISMPLGSAKTHYVYTLGPKVSRAGRQMQLIELQGKLGPQDWDGKSMEFADQSYTGTIYFDSESGQTLENEMAITMKMVNEVDGNEVTAEASQTINISVTPKPRE